jgi:hypothetical protein
VGSNEAKATINRFMTTLKAALDNFPATVPAPTVVGMIAGAIGQVAATVADLRDRFSQLPDALSAAISLGSITGSSDDDRARNAVSQMHSQGWLGNAPTNKCKLHFIQACLDGITDDDDETSINRVLETAKANDLAELYQLVAGATWEALDSSMDGDEYDTMESMLTPPPIW